MPSPMLYKSHESEVQIVVEAQGPSPPITDPELVYIESPAPTKLDCYEGVEASPDVSGQRASKKVKGSISIKMFEEEIMLDGNGGKPTEEEQALCKTLKEMDIDGDGTLSIRELLNLSKSLNNSRTQNKQLMKLVVGITVLAVVAMALMFGVTYSAVQAAKDSKPSSSGQLQTMSGTPVSVSLTTYNLQSWQIPAQPFDVIEELKSFKMWGDDEKFHVYTIAGFSWTNSTSMQLFSHLGDVIAIEGRSVAVTTMDGNLIKDAASIPTLRRKLQFKSFSTSNKGGTQGGSGSVNACAKVAGTGQVEDR